MTSVPHKDIACASLTKLNAPTCGAGTMSHRVDQLSANTNYRISVMVSNPGGHSDISYVSVVTPPSHGQSFIPVNSSNNNRNKTTNNNKQSTARRLFWVINDSILNYMILPIYDFLLVTNSDFGRICYCFRDIDA